MTATPCPYGPWATETPLTDHPVLLKQLRISLESAEESAPDVSLLHTPARIPLNFESSPAESAHAAAEKSLSRRALAVCSATTRALSSACSAFAISDWATFAAATASFRALVNSACFADRSAIVLSAARFDSAAKL